MSNKIWDDKSTDLSLNGPNLSFSSDITANQTSIAPFGDTGISTMPTSVVFSGVGVCTFPDGSNADGTINYQWYDASTNQALGVSTQYSGQTTNQLTWSYGSSSEDNGKSFYLQADFTPTVGGASGEPRNEPLRSPSDVSLNVLPELFVATGPSTSSVAINVDTTFNCLGVINVGKFTSYEETEGDKISYQWYIDDVAVSDGERTTTRSADTFVENYDSEGIYVLQIPDDATNVSIRVAGAAGGAGGSDTNGAGGSAGKGRFGKFTIPDGGRTLEIEIGTRGKNGANRDSGAGGGGGSSTISLGGTGGNDGAGGSGGGGGGGAGTFVKDTVSDTIIIAAGGGGGGGGGSDNMAGTDGGNANDWSSQDGEGMALPFTVGSNGDGSDGTTGQDGGGGGGGGGGHRGGGGGSMGKDNPPPPPPPPKPDPPPPPEPAPPPPPPPPSGGIPCFVPDAYVVLDRSTGNVVSAKDYRVVKRISDIEVGDKVSNKDGTDENEVVFIEKHEPSSKDPSLYSPSDEIKPFATTNHPLFVDGEWVAVDVNAHPWLENPRPLRDVNLEEVGDRNLYNLWVTGDGTYIVNGYGTHSIMYDGGFMKNCFKQGLLNHDQVMKLMRSYTYEKTDLVVGAFMLNKICGKINLPWFNKIILNFMNASDGTLRKKIMHYMMKILQKKYGVN